MDLTLRTLRPDARLSCAMELLFGARVVADVGCDHGRLACALAQRGAARCIAIDISPASIEKTRRLAAHIGVSDRVDARLGDGLTPITPGEADAAAILGVGGSLMARMLEAAEEPLAGARRCVLQPMRGVAEIRRWLFFRGYVVLDDRVVYEGGRYYQVFSAAPPGERERAQTLPDGWPEDFFDLGFVALERREPLFGALAERLLAQTERRRRAQHAEALKRRSDDLKRVLRLWEERLCR